MAEIITCPKCEKKLQVPEAFFGQTVQCPECRHPFVAQQSAVSATPILAASPQPEAQRKSRRFDNDEDEEDFHLDVRRRRRRREEADDDDFPMRRRYPGDYAAHRGGLVMALGLVALVGGFAFCVPVLIGPIAWILGTMDLRAMRDGHMDPTGESMTRSGQICGIIATVFLLLSGLFFGALFMMDN
jgi:hypothetical protein